MLAEHPKALAKLRQEILNKVGSTRRPTHDDFKELKYLRVRERLISFWNKSLMQILGCVEWYAAGFEFSKRSTEPHRDAQKRCGFIHPCMSVDAESCITLISCSVFLCSSSPLNTR